MSGDYSRHRFNPRNDYSGVRMQQGRVQLDADWNEWTDAIDRRKRAETVDTFGVVLSTDITGVAVVSPQTPDAFLILTGSGNLTIGPGRMYVDGLLAENFGDPDGAQAFDPVLAEQHGLDAISYAQQPYHPDPVTLPTGGPHLVYLEAWQREVTHLQQPDLVEKALAVDTTTRVQTAWQVRLLENIGDSITCTSPDADLGTDWSAIISPSAGRLSSRPAQVSGDTDPCELPPGGGYRGLENQLYRIEIHNGGNVGAARFKWSRDNASVAAAVVEVVSGSELKLASLGRDAVLRFNTGDWVEIIDDWRELSGENGDPARRFGEIRKITVDDAKKTISFTTALPADLIPSGSGDDTLEKRHLRVIRWDQKGVVRDADDNVIVDLDASGSDGLIPVPGPGVWVHLENGVQVRFSRDPDTGSFRCNDFWNVAARTSDASVEIYNTAPPQGIHRHYTRLALVTFPDGETDCREHWPPSCGGCCTIIVRPGEDIQAAIDSLPEEGGCICLKTGVHEIGAPLEIHSSRILFHGESPGTVVRAVSSLLYMLEIGSADLLVTDIEVLDIRFEVIEQPGASGGSLLYLNHCAEVRISGCELDVVVAEGQAAYIGILMQDVRDVVVAGNQLSNMYSGIRVSDYLDRLVIEHNIIAGVRITLDGVDSSFGEYGIHIENDFVVPCRIEHNRINHFWWGILLRDGARGSTVSNNTFLRLGELLQLSMPTTMDELRAYLDEQYFAIDIEAEQCRVEGNEINLAAPQWGGIRTRGEQTLIADNILRASGKTSPFTPVPGGIYCYGLTDVDSAGNFSTIRGNRLIGPQTGIIVSRVNGVTVENNAADGMNTGWFGVRVADSSNVRVCVNTVENIFFGIYHSGGIGNHVCDNHITLCLMGISSLSENYLDVSRNDLFACIMTGIVLEVKATARVTENRVMHCGYGGAASLGIAVFAEHILTETESMVRIIGNEVQDTGVNPFTNAGSNTASIGIGALCSSCNISHNHTNYSRDVLNAALAHRALLLIGPLALHYDFNEVSVEWMNGSAVVTDNRFRGPALGYLVDFFSFQIADNIDFRFEKVTFNNNICEHLHAELQEGTATVRLWGRNLIAMGNHVKAADGVNSLSLGNRHRVALMGNITTGGYIRVGTTTPAPLTDFNIRT